jgi:hypothetical protein
MMIENRIMKHGHEWRGVRKQQTGLLAKARSNLTHRPRDMMISIS